MANVAPVDMCDAVEVVRAPVGGLMGSTKFLLLRIF